MLNENLKNELRFIVETRLTTLLKLLNEAHGKIPQEKKDNEEIKAIINFINQLPERYRNIPDRDLIIINSLEKMGISTLWGRKKKEEIENSEKNNLTINKEKETNNLKNQEQK